MESFLEELRPEEPADTRDEELRALGALLREEEDRGTETEGRDDGLRLRLVLTREVLLGADDGDRPTDREEPERDRVAAGADTLEGVLLVRVLSVD